MSKRVKSAVDRIGKTPEEIIAEEMEALAKAQQKKMRGKRQTENVKSKNSSRKKNNSAKANEENGSSTGAESKTKQRRTRKKPSEDSASKPSDSKKPRRKKNTSEEKSSSEKAEAAAETSLEQDQNMDEEDELQKYENIAKELKKRRQRRNELSKKVDPVIKKKQMKPQVVKEPVDIVPENIQGEEKDMPSLSKGQSQSISEEIHDQGNIAKDLIGESLKTNEQSKCDDTIVKKQGKPQVDKNIQAIPEGLEDDEEIKFFQATTSRSLKRVEEIDREVKNELDQEAKKKRLPNFHKKEVIHQKLRDKSDVLRNKMKAIEVFRKSKKGPGYVEKRKKKINLPKEDAELSENSSDE